MSDIVLLSLTPFPLYSFFFFFNDTATTEIYTLSLHDALPISSLSLVPNARTESAAINEVEMRDPGPSAARNAWSARSEEHTSELQSPCNLVCRLLLEKKKRLTTSVTKDTAQIVSTEFY